jgi:hypothetical protein
MAQTPAQFYLPKLLARVEAAMDFEDERQQRIRERAYALWQIAGCPEGQYEAFWRKAAEIENAQPQMKEPELRDPGPAYP